MTLRTIVTLPEPVLRRKAHTVNKFDKNLQTLLDDMVETMREAPGVGLAAPQVGLSDRIIVIEYCEHEEDEENEEAPKKVWAVFNPEIVKSSEETLMGVEGCLSIPGLVGEVERQFRGPSERYEPARQANEDQSQGLAGTYLSARDRSSGWRAFHRTSHSCLATFSGS